MSQKIRIKLKSYDHKLVDKSAEKIVKAVKATGAIVQRSYSIANSQAHLHCKPSVLSLTRNHASSSSSQTYKRLIDIYSSTAKTVDALMKLELPSGVEVEIKVYVNYSKFFKIFN